ncbi:hypothetical protein [Nocardia sp. NPDC050710]|uniref:hypothetical protein n=1 Tax=Nocardia sp. NPDC050710 TaxID=3157220 RepID=UPI0033DE71C9
MGLDRAQADEELGGDLGVGPAPGHQREHLLLALGKRVDGLDRYHRRLVGEGRQQSAGDVGVPVTAFNALGESWLYFYGLGIVLEVILLALILRYAWTWPRTFGDRGDQPGP